MPHERLMVYQAHLNFREKSKKIPAGYTILIRKFICEWYNLPLFAVSTTSVSRNRQRLNEDSFLNCQFIKISLPTYKLYNYLNKITNEKINILHAYIP